jgi:hypothetical protein
MPFLVMRTGELDSLGIEVPGLLSCRDIVVGVLVILGRAQHDLALPSPAGDRQCLEDHVEPVALLMGERSADREYREDATV